MTAKEFQQYLKTLEKEFNDFLTQKAPTLAGNVAVELFKKIFQDESFFGEKWKEVQRRMLGTKTYKSVALKHPTDHKSKVLTGRTGDLGKSVDVQKVANGQAIIWTTPGVFTSKEPYGRVHNEGLRAGRGKGFQMPKRQFIGEHALLTQAIADKLQSKLQETINKQRKKS